MTACPQYVEGAAARPEGKRPHALLLLDRDGVINVDHGYVHRPEGTQWVEGIFRLATVAINSDVGIVVCTNQAGIGRGLYSDAEFLSYTGWVHQQFEANDTPILRTYYCPHHKEAISDEYVIDCFCRKPNPGMLLSALDDFDVPASRCLMIGDKQTDLDAAKAAGVGSLLCDSNDLSPLMGQVGDWIAMLAVPSELDGVSSSVIKSPS